MVKRIKHVSALPDWYSLDKYKNADSLDAAGWYEQLSVRADIFYLSEAQREQLGRREGPARRSKGLIKALNLIRATPIIDLTSDDLLRAIFGGGSLQELKSRDPIYTLGVRATTVRSLYMTELNIEKGKRSYARNFFGQFDDHGWLKPFKYRGMEWMDRPVDEIVDSSGLYINTQVNLRLPDKVLIAQFKQFLKDKRSPLQRLGILVENKQKSYFAAWQRFGVLPYLDLRIWEEETAVKLSNRVIADAIFAAGDGGEEVVRKTTAKLAKSLLAKEHLETLASFAAQEIMNGSRAHTATMLEIAERNIDQTLPEKN
jgi:hypothetical protein